MKVGLALGGGGAKGLAHIEFLKVFDELGVKPDMIVGTSMGALIGTLYASGKSGEYLEKKFSRLSKVETFRMVDVNFNGKSLIKGNKIYSWISKELPVKKFNQLQIPTKIVATDFTNMKPYVLQTGDLFTAIKASTAMPGILPSVEYKKRTLIDGGVYDEVPFEILKGYKIAIDVASKMSPPKNPNIYDNVINTFHMMTKKIGDSKKVKPDLLVQPDLSNVGLMDFHKYKQVKFAVKNDVKTFKRKLKKLYK